MVSVIIPNYNHANYLKQRIDSILNQTYTNFNIIILDDCSTDQSKEIIEAYRTHEKIKTIVYNDQNSGSTFKQWEKGIELADGEWIWIAESDDWCEPNLLETLVKGAGENTVLAIAQSLVVNDDGKILWNSDATYFEESMPGLKFVKDEMVLDNYGIPNASMCIFKKSAYAKVDKEFTNYKFCGDWLFWILISLQGDVFVSGKILNYFRKHNNDVSGKAYKNGLSYSEFFSLLDSLVERGVLNETEKYNALVFKFKVFLNDNRLEDGVRRRLRKQFRTMVNSKYYPSILREGTIRFLKKHLK